jgi:DNA repair protein RadB
VLYKGSIDACLPIVLVPVISFSPRLFREGDNNGPPYPRSSVFICLTKLECASEYLIIPSNSPIDSLLDGGVQTGLLTHVYGSAGCGKTTLALQVSISAALCGYDVLYCDTEESFPPDRLSQMTGAGKEARELDRIIVSQPTSFDDQHDCFLRLGAEGGESWGLHQLRVVIVDTLTRHYRSEYSRKPRVKVFRKLADQQLPALLKAARKFDIAVLLLNQVSPDMSSTLNFKPVGGDAVSRIAKYELKLQKEENSGIGFATLTKAPRLAQTGKTTHYVITRYGITQTTPQVQANFDGAFLVL